MNTTYTADKHVIRNEKDTDNLNIISEYKIIDHYKAPCRNVLYSNIEADDFVIYKEDLIMIQEPDETLRKTENRKAMGQNCLNRDILLQLLHVYMCWKRLAITA